MTRFSTDGFSVVMPTHRRPGSIRQVLDGLCRQDYPLGLLEVEVVVDGPDEETVRLLEQRYPFRVGVHQQNARGGPAAARNHALRHVRAPFVLFLDDDVIPDARLVSEHRRAHGGATDLVVIGPLLAPAGERAAPWTRWEWSTLEEQYRAMTSGEWQPTPRQFYTGNASLRREHLGAVGGFDEAFRRGEDVELAWRLNRIGLRFVFEPAAAGVHLARRSFASWLAAAYEYGRTDVMLERGRTGAEIPAWVLREFAGRHPQTRRLALAGLRHPWLVSAMRRAGEPLVRCAGALGGSARGGHACSALFTMTYWDGVADALGDRRCLIDRLSRAAGSPQAGAHSRRSAR